MRECEENGMSLDDEPEAPDATDRSMMEQVLDRTKVFRNIETGDVVVCSNGFERKCWDARRRVWDTTPNLPTPESFFRDAPWFTELDDPLEVIFWYAGSVRGVMPTSDTDDSAHVPKDSLIGELSKVLADRGGGYGDEDVFWEIAKSWEQHLENQLDDGQPAGPVIHAANVALMMARLKLERLERRMRLGRLVKDDYIDAMLYIDWAYRKQADQGGDDE
jgi:hypothetical protein